MNDEEYYVRLGRLLERTPEFRADKQEEEIEARWMAEAFALVGTVDPVEAGSLRELMTFVAGPSSYSREMAVKSFLRSIHRSLAVAELKAPAAVQGAFISAGSSFDAFGVIARVLGTAVSSARIVDPYMDEKALVEFAVLAQPHVTIELLADKASVKPSLQPAVQAWHRQYASERPLEARLTPPRALHDRLIIIDRAEVWTLTQSLAHFAARSPASVVRIDGETAALKVQAYEAIWLSSVALHD